MKTSFRAYGDRGHLEQCTWASTAASIAAEKAAYQERLNRGEFQWVEVVSTDPEVQIERMYPDNNG